MKIEHIGVWVNKLQKMKDFYIKYFNLICSDQYRNEKKGFSSYFLSFDSGCRIELMNIPGIATNNSSKEIPIGLAHIAISCGSRKKVNELTEILRSDGFEIVGEPRLTEDRYYESVVLDPEGNKIEITE